MISTLGMLLLPCFSISIIFYGMWCITIDALYHVLPFGVLFAFGLVAAIQFFRVPPPDNAAVETIVGKDPFIETGITNHIIRTVAHRGAGMDAPENSLAAFQLCKDRGCNAIEFDITLTADGVPIVFHDETIERMAGCTGVVNKLPWTDLQNVDISVNHAFRDRFIKTYIPTLEQTIKQLKSSGQHMFIDIKDNDRKMVNVILDLYDSCPELYSIAVVSSFFPNIIYLIRRKNPKIVCSLAWRPYAFSRVSFDFFNGGPGPKRTNNWCKHFIFYLCDVIHEWLLSKITYYVLGLSLILLHKDTISGSKVLKWRNKGIRVIAWTVNSPTEKQYCAKILKITYMTDTLTGESSTHIGVH